MKDPAKKYARMIAKAMKKAGRSDYRELESAFYRRFRTHQQSEIYREYLAKYPSIGVEKVYIGITFAQVLMQRGCSLRQASTAVCIAIACWNCERRSSDGTSFGSGK